jgi:hypothetical protein
MVVDSTEFTFMKTWIKQYETEHNVSFPPHTKHKFCFLLTTLSSHPTHPQDDAVSQLAKKTKDFVEEPISESDSLDSIQNEANIISRVAMFSPETNGQFAPLIERLQALVE